jgi:hypothetical protein
VARVGTLVEDSPGRRDADWCHVRARSWLSDFKIRSASRMTPHMVLSGSNSCPSRVGHISTRNMVAVFIVDHDLF